MALIPGQIICNVMTYNNGHRFAASRQPTQYSYIAVQCPPILEKKILLKNVSQIELLVVCSPCAGMPPLLIPTWTMDLILASKLRDLPRR